MDKAIEDFDHTWLRLELRHLAALSAVVRLGSFRAAAASLGYSQSAVSVQIRALEEIVGASVLQRSPGAGAAAPTPAGRALLAAAPALIAAMRDAQRGMAAAMQSRPVLRVGIFPTAAVALLPGVLQRLDPEIEVVLHEQPDPEDLERALQLGRLDVSFLSSESAGDDLAQAALLDDPYVVLVPRDGAFSKTRRFSVERLRDLPVIAYRSLPDAVDPLLLLPPEFRPRRIATRTDDDRTVHALVAAGLGVALLPALSIDAHDPRVRAVALRPALPPRRIVLAWRAAANRPPAVQAFIDAAQASARAATRSSPGTRAAS